MFNFSVLVLEIISGKKNINFYQSHHADDLLSHVSIFILKSAANARLKIIMQMKNDRNFKLKRQVLVLPQA